MSKVITIGLDIAKHVFQVHGVDEAGAVVIRRKLRRAEVLQFFEALDPCLVGIEACATAPDPPANHADQCAASAPSRVWDHHGPRACRRGNADDGAARGNDAALGIGRDLSTTKPARSVRSAQSQVWMLEK
jgi:hypothetical protein